MKIEKDLVATIDYKLTDESGQVLDTSEGSEPLSYIHGNGNLITGLERDLDGKEPGDRVTTVIAPEDGYGVYDEKLVFTVEKKDFDEPDDLEVGMYFQAEVGGEVKLCTIVEMSDETVQVNANHPLSGVTLHFDVTVRDVREATKEELEHGHVHGDGDGHDEHQH